MRISRTADGGGADSAEAEEEAFTALDGPFKLKTVAGRAWQERRKNNTAVMDGARR
jgi:hypothetical protein